MRTSGPGNGSKMVCDGIKTITSPSSFVHAENMMPPSLPYVNEFEIKEDLGHVILSRDV